MSKTTPAKLASLGLALALPLAIFFWTWWSPIARYRVAIPELDAGEVRSLRSQPRVEVFKSLNELRFDHPPWTTRAELVEAADAALQGKIRLRGLPEWTVHLPFDAADISAGPPSIQLANASLLVPQLFMDAYSTTADE